MSSQTPLKLKPVSNGAVWRSRARNWRILIVDDDEEVHAVTRMILNKLEYRGRRVELLSAYSAAEARELLEREGDIAAILLDVVMESEHAGLDLVRTIREELGNTATRIILRTGQPGQAPEEKVIVNYDINDYKAKNELTAQKLFTTTIAALRSYETIVSLERMRTGLEKILDSTSTLFQVYSLQRFASGVLEQLSAFLGCRPNGIICAQSETAQPDTTLPAIDDLRILAATGQYVACMERGGECIPEEMLQIMRSALTQHANQITDDYLVFYLDAGSGTAATAALLHGGLGEVDENDRKLLQIFTNEISIAMANVLNYQKMITAEQAATTDYLTGLDNRRQLLRLGAILLAQARRARTPLALAMMDVDRFKAINDTWGHDAGDQVLRRLGEMLKGNFRSSDVVARFGGEEFCVVATDLAVESVFELFDELRLRIAEETFEFGGQKCSISISIGVTCDLAENIDGMISRADELLYQAKREGRNRVLLG